MAANSETWNSDTRFTTSLLTRSTLAVPFSRARRMSREFPSAPGRFTGAPLDTLVVLDLVPRRSRATASASSIAAFSARLRSVDVCGEVGECGSVASARGDGW